MTIDEIYDAIQEVNDDGGENLLKFPVRLITDGCLFKIVWQDITLWHEDEDERKWVEEENKYEPLVPYLLRRQKEVIREIITDYNMRKRITCANAILKD